MIRYAKIVLEFLHRNFKPFFNLQHVYIFAFGTAILELVNNPFPSPNQLSLLASRIQQLTPSSREDTLY